MASSSRVTQTSLSLLLGRAQHVQISAALYSLSSDLMEAESISNEKAFRAWLGVGATLSSCPVPRHLQAGVFQGRNNYRVSSKLLSGATPFCFLRL